MDLNDKKNISGNLIQEPPEQFQVRSATSGVGWDVCEVQPPFPCYVGVDDVLQLTNFSNAGSNNVTVNVRMLGLDGLIHPLQFATITGGGRTASTIRFNLMEGWLLSAEVMSTNGVSGGSYIYAVLGLSRAPFGAANTYHILCEGYIASSAGLCYPTSSNQRQTDGAGLIRSVNQAAPAAGADLQITVPTAARWRLVCFRATLTTSVAVANRLVSLTVDDGATVYFESPSGISLAASLSNIYNFSDSSGYMTAAGFAKSNGPIASNLFLTGGHRINTLTTAIQAADQWSSAQFQVVEWQDVN
jgi:hypothetical protein